MSRRKVPGIPEPTVDPSSLLQAVTALKEAMEVILGHRHGKGSRLDSAVTWQDLVDLELIEAGQVPRD